MIVVEVGSDSPESPAEHIQRLERNNRELRRQLVVACLDKDDALMTIASVAMQRNTLAQNNIHLVDENRMLREKWDKLNREFKEYRDVMVTGIASIH